MTEDTAQPHGAYILLGSAWSSYLPIISFCAQITKATAGKATCVVGWLFVPLHRHTAWDQCSLIKVASICQHLLLRPVICYNILSCFLRLIKHIYSLGDLTVTSGICWGQGTTFTVSLTSSDITGSNFKPHYFYPVTLNLTVFWLSIYLLQLVGCNLLSVAIIIFCLGLSSEIFFNEITYIFSDYSLEREKRIL